MPVFLSTPSRIVDPLTAFGELSTAPLTPVIQASTVYGINTRLFTTSATTGNVAASGGFAVLSTTAAQNANAQLVTRRFIKYRTGQGVDARFTAIFTPGVAGSQQIIGPGDADNGLFFGYNGAAFGVMVRNGGVDGWIPQTEWNVDKMDGTGPSGMVLNTSKGNVFRVKFQWLGFGAQFFYIEDDKQGSFQLVHVRDYANQYVVPSMTNPSFPIMARVSNTTNATNVVMKCPSFAAFNEGLVVPLGPKNAEGFTKTGVTTTFTNIITIRNKSTFATLTNRVPVILDSLSVGVSGSRPARIRLVSGTTLGGTPSYTSIDANNSVVEYDTAGTTLTGGDVLLDLTVGSTANIYLSREDLRLELFPGEWVTLAVASTTSTTDATATIGWQEDF